MHEKQFAANEANRHHRPSLIEIFKGADTKIHNLSVISATYDKSPNSKGFFLNSNFLMKKKFLF